VVTTCTTWFNIHYLCIWPTVYLCGFILDYFPEQHQPVDLCNGEVLCLLWGADCISTYALDELQLQTFSIDFHCHHSRGWLMDLVFSTRKVIYNIFKDHTSLQLNVEPASSFMTSHVMSCFLNDLPTLASLIARSIPKAGGIGYSLL
jgi:hypothetical protein